ncbi:diguanylate cyclase [Amycolatopsis minnesotensis]|uniref:Diguanylate cyclase (GGDEF)-like protein n=1 Tax=Amycolatopsis minnesotensis TaxID=337894 RepID=A0ABN2S1T6_9PSEU
MTVTGGRVRTAAWSAYLIAGVLVTALYYVVVSLGLNAIISVTLYCLVSASSAVAVLVSTARGRTAPRAPWLFVGVSQLVYAAADSVFYVSHFVLGSTTFPGLADVLYLSHYPFIVVGLIVLIRLRNPGGDVQGVLDAAMLVVVAGTLSWLYLIGPNARADTPGVTKLASVAYPILDLAMLSVSLLLILGRGRRPVSFSFLSANLVAFFAADSIYVFQQLAGTYQVGNFLDAIWLSGNLALGAAALHPTAKQVSDRAPASDHRLGAGRIIALLTAALVAPLILLVQYGRGELRDIPVVAVACAVLFMLIITRLGGLVIQHRQLAITDGLTGLYTRRFFETQLPLELARARRGGHRLTVLIVDVDRFKAINDRYGHPAGDRVLVEVVARLREVTRSGDVLARYGGEEFALLAPGIGPEELHAIAERLRETTRSAPVRISEELSVPVTVSVGAAVFPLHGATPLELVTTADRALYTAKQSGRDRVVAADVLDPSALAGHGGDGASGREASLAYLRTVADEVDGWTSTAGHGGAVGRWAGLVCAELGHDEGTARRAEVAGRLRDIGKLFVPRRIWAKPGNLAEDELRLVRAHPEHGFHLLRVIPGMLELASVVRQHHERHDGSGYPAGLSGGGIRVEARVVAVCDAWAAMLAGRPHRPAVEPGLARAELVRGSGTRFDPAVVAAFLRLYDDGLIGDLRHPANTAPSPAS